MQHNRRISDGQVKLRGTIRHETHDVRTGALIPDESGFQANVVVTVGLPQLVKILAQSSYTTGYEIAVGTGTTAATTGDTALETEVFRDDITSKLASGVTLTCKLYLDSTEANGNTLSEAGLFFDSVMLDRAILSPTISKTSTKAVTVQVDLTLS